MASCLSGARLGVVRQYTAAVIASISVVACGSSFAWITPLLPQLSSEDSEIRMTGGQLSLAVSLIEVGDVFTPIPAAMLADLFGRKPVLLVTGPLQLVAWLIVLFTRSFPCLCLARFMQGMGMGVVYAVLPVYLGEIASPDIRGRIGIFVQYGWHLGLIYEFAIGPFLTYDKIVLASLPLPILFTVMFVWFPESPHFLAKRGRIEDATKALSWLRGGHHDEVETILSEADGRAGASSWRELFCTGKGLRGLAVATGVAAISELGGLSAISAYASIVFSPGGQVVCTLIVGVIPLLVFPLFGKLMDAIGRRPVLMVSSVIASAAIFLAGLYRLLSPSWIPLWVSDLLVVVYVVFLSGGAEAAYPIVQSEMFSSTTRALGSSVMIVLATLLALAAFQILYFLIAYVGFYLVFFLFAVVVCALGVVLVYYCLPETKGKTFEEIQKSL